MKLTRQQKIIDELCDQYEVPRIRVTLKDDLRGSLAVFYNVTFEIFVNRKTTISVLRHEFYHYLVQLLSSAERLEEDMCDLFGEKK